MMPLSPARRRRRGCRPWTYWGALSLTVLAVACGSSGSFLDPDNPSDPNPSDPDPEPGDWALVWSDEFDSGTLDQAKWSIQVGDGCDLGICGWGNNELQWYQGANVAVSNGLLVVTAREESAGGKSFTSARIRSKDKGDWTFARVEFRARLPQGQGMWPAVWMLPTDEKYGVWAASGEIDIMELVGNEPNVVHGTLHYGGTWPNNKSSGRPFYLSSGTFADGFHTFAMEWEEGVIRWYVDGQLYQTQTTWDTSSASFPAPFDQRFHLLINLAVGGNWPGSPDDTTQWPQTLEVDWIRVYQRQ